MSDCDIMDCSTPGFPVHHQLPEIAQAHVHRVSEAIQPSHSLSSPSPAAFNLSQHQGLFQSVSSSHQVVKYWRFSFSISPSNEYSGLISFRMDQLDLLAVQGTLKSLLQYHSLKASVHFSLVTKSCPPLCDPMDCGMPGFPVLHQLPELAQTHVHRVSDAIQPSHPLSSPSPAAFNLSQHRGFFQ